MKQISEEDLAKAMLTLQDDMPVENMSKDFKRILSALQDCHCDDYQNSFKFMDDEIKNLYAENARLVEENHRKSQILKIYYEYLARNGYGIQLNDIIKEVESLPEAEGKED